MIRIYSVLFPRLSSSANNYRKERNKHHHQSPWDSTNECGKTIRIFFYLFLVQLAQFPGVFFSLLPNIGASPCYPTFLSRKKVSITRRKQQKGGEKVAPTSSPDFPKARAKQGPSFPRQTSSGKRGGSGEIPISLARNRLLWELAVSRQRGGEIGLARTRCGGRYNESGESDHGPRPTQ